MEYTNEEKVLLIGRALGLIRHGHRTDVGKLMDKHPDVFKCIISSIVIGEIEKDYQIEESIRNMAKEMGFKESLLY